MKHMILASLLCLFISFGAFAADKPAKTTVTEKADECSFDPNHLIVDNVVKLYSCVPIADHLCAQSCGGKAASTDINTTIKDGKIGRTTIICKGGDDKSVSSTPYKVFVDGLADGISLRCD